MRLLAWAALGLKTARMGRMSVAFARSYQMVRMSGAGDRMWVRARVRRIVKERWWAVYHLCRLTRLRASAEDKSRGTGNVRLPRLGTNSEPVKIVTYVASNVKANTLGGECTKCVFNFRLLHV